MLFAGLTVCIALCGMFIVGVSVLSGAAVAASIAVLFPMAAAQTLLPALIGFLGHRTLTRKQRRALAAGDVNPAEASARWARWADLVQKNRLVLGVAALAVMVALAVPASSMRLGSADYGTDPTTTTTTTHRAYELLDVESAQHASPYSFQNGRCTQPSSTGLTVCTLRTSSENFHPSGSRR